MEVKNVMSLEKPEVREGNTESLDEKDPVSWTEIGSEGIDYLDWEAQ